MIGLVRRHRLVAIVIAMFLGLALLYSIVTPIFEAGDEIWHYPYVQHLQTDHRLIVQEPRIRTLWAQEGGQPPLYYALSALMTFWIDTSDLPDRLWRNPHAAIGIPLLYGNKNMIVHTSAENFPWHNTALAVHLIRFLSILFSVGTIMFTYSLALELKNDQRLAAFAAGLVALNPMFIFISASVNNDSLAASLAAFSLWWMVRMAKSAKREWTSYGVLGLVLGLGAITKVSDLGLIVVAGGVLLYLLRKDVLENAKDRPIVHQPALAGICLSAVLVVLIGSWWYIRNYMLYADPFAFNVWIDIAGGRPDSVTFESLLGEFQGMRISFWGNFGGVNIIAPEWVYVFLDGVTIVAGLGLLIGLARRALPIYLALPAFWLTLIFIALVRWTSLTFASQGRLLFPAICAIGVLLAFGLHELRARVGDVDPDVRRSSSLLFGSYWPFLIPTCFLFGFAALAPFYLIAPNYAIPPRLAADSGVPNPTHIVFEEQVELVGYSLPQKTLIDHELPITIYWRGLKTLGEDFSVYIHLLDLRGNPIGQWDAYPGNGLYPTRFWRPGEILMDNYRVPVSADVPTPSVGRIEVGLYRLSEMKNLVGRDPKGQVVTPSIARFKIPGRAEVRIENPINEIFGERIALVGFSADDHIAPGSTWNIQLDWRALALIDADYTIFVHLIDANGKTFVQKDEQPQSGAYPTSFWDVGETIADAHAIEIPRDAALGEYRIRVGLYRPSDGSRLSLIKGDEADLGALSVTK